MKALVFKSTQSITKEKQTVKSTSLVCKRENPPVHSISMNGAVNLLLAFNELGYRLGLRSGGIHTVMCLYRSFVLYGVGMTNWELVKMMKLGNGYYTAMNVRLNMLMNNGLIEIGGTGKNHAAVYIPTDYLIAELDSVFKPG